MRARGLFAFLLVGAVVIGSCAAVDVERGGPGADGTPLVVVACAEEEPDCQDTLVDSDVPTGGEDPIAPPDSDGGEVSGGMVVAPLSVSDAASYEGSESVAVTGYVVVEDGSGHLCEALAESYPPQCGGDNIVITNAYATVDLVLVEEGSTQWSPEPVILLGTVTPEGLTIDPTSM